MDSIVLTGMIIKTSDVGESDRREVILTKERGKITAFARGAKRPKSTLVSATRLFVFGEFTLVEGSKSYSLIKADISRYFEDISTDLVAMCYGSYFLELADFLTMENMESVEMLRLVYITLNSLLNEKIPDRLIKCIFELRCMVINGEYPQVFECVACGKKEIRYFSFNRKGMLCRECGEKNGDSLLLDNDIIYSMQYIISSDIKKLYTFTVSENVLKNLEYIMKRLTGEWIKKDFKSLKILETITT